MNKRFSRLPQSVIFSVIVTVVISGLAGTVLLVQIMTPQIKTYFNIRNKADLQLASQMGLEICENRFEELLALRLSENTEMVATMRNDALQRIKNLPSRFAHIECIIVEDGRNIIVDTGAVARLVSPELPLPNKMPRSSEMYRLEDDSFIYWYYFPFWRWHIVAFIHNADAIDPVVFIRRNIFLVLFGILIIFTTSLLWVFFLKVQRPLKSLSRVAQQVQEGEMVKTTIRRQDEIGVVAHAFNEMIEGLSTTMRSLESSIHEKEVLLKEVHHRVRNNLNIIISLLNLRSETLPQVPEVTMAFQESKDRIRTMAMIHERLYESGDFGHIRIDEYIVDLMQTIRQSYDVKQIVQVQLALDPIRIALNEAIPLGLILNEAITNSFKHAFVNRDHGEISVSLTQQEGRFWVTISDDGIGIPYPKEKKKDISLGLVLIEELTQQLQGSVSITAKNGTTLTLTFPA